MKTSRNDKVLETCRRNSEESNKDNSSSGSSAERTTTRSNVKAGQHNKSSTESSSSACTQVVFYDKVQGWEILSHRNFSEEEHRNSWITEADAKASQGHIFKAVRTIRKKIRHGQSIPSCLNDNDDLCVRGLQKMHTSQSDQIVENRKVDVRYAVFEEQHRQRQRDKLDPKRIARASMVNSSKSMDLAISRAAKDAAYVNLHVRARPSARRSLEHVQQRRKPGAGMNGIEISFLNVNVSGSSEEEQQSNSSLLSSPTNPNQPRRQDSSLTTLEQSSQSLLTTPTNPNQPRKRDSSLTTLEQSDRSLLSSPTNPNHPRRRDSSLTTMDEQGGNESTSATISNHSSLTNPNEQSLRSVESSAIATDSASTLGSRRSIESRTLIRQGRGLYRPRSDPNQRSL